MSDLDKPCPGSQQRYRVDLNTAELITGADQYDLRNYDTKATDEIIRIALSYRSLSQEMNESWNNRKLRS